MPYASMDEVNPAIKGIKPPITLAQANMIAEWADKIEDVESPWAVAIANFKKAYVVEDGKWIKRAAEVDMGELNEAVTKSVSGKDLPASSFLVVGDPEEVGTWVLPVKDMAGNADHRRMGGAWASLHGGYRGQKYEGPGKTGAITKLRALYKAEDMPIPGVATEAAAHIREALAMMSLSEQERRVRDAFLVAYGGDGDSYVSTPYRSRYWVRDVFIAPSEFGDAVVVEKGSKYYLVSYSEDGDRIVFDDPPNWKTVVPTYRVEAATSEADDSPGETELETVKIAEAYIGASPELLTIGIAEANAQGPLTMKVKLIEPGFGNKRDNHYYPAEMLQRDAHVFIGSKMHESDHKGDKSTRTWVSYITDILGFSETGAPIAKVVVHDPNFAQRVRNLAEENLLDKMECSILADAKVKRNQKVEGRKANVVERITVGGDVDWVTRAGAGGKALSISESEDSMTDKDEKDAKLDEGGTEEPKQEEPKVEAPPKPLDEKQVTDILTETNLPESAKTYLAEGEYGDEAAVKEAVAKHIEYLKAVTGSGKPFGHEGGSTEATMSDEDYDKRYVGIMESHGVRQFGN